tara:strand:- start:5777 stop:7039 length:1263 start_codon:yes stop_codon:yes gene_type:complete
MSKKNQWKVSKVDQKKSRRQKFSSDRYWCISYTEKSIHGVERDFKTFIKARSAKLATEILEGRLKEDKEFSRMSTAVASLVHKKWNIRALHKPLTISQWAAVRALSFPNDRNKVFKFEKERQKGQVNRLNTAQKELSEERKTHLRKMAYNLSQEYLKDTFKPLCPKLREECTQRAYKARKGYASLNNPDHKERELTFLRNLMQECGGNKQYAADSIGVSRSVLYRALKRFKGDVDWEKEYPLTYTRPVPNTMECPKARANLARTLKKIGHRPPPNKRGTPQYKKWKKTISASWKEKSAKMTAEWKNKLIKALRDNHHHRQNTATALGISVGYMNRLMTDFAKEDPEFYKEFRHPDVIQALRTQSIQKTKADKQANFVKENKHVIMQAYYQNDKSDNKACKLFKVCRTTFRAWRESIENNE